MRKLMLGVAIALTVGELVTVGVARCGGTLTSLADGDPVSVSPTPANGHRIRELVAGERQTCALYTNGTAACWGSRARYSLGLVPSNDEGSNVPVPIPGLTDAVSIDVGDCHGCALDASGHLSCWGYRGPYCNDDLPLPPLMPHAARVPSVPPLRALLPESLGSSSCGVSADEEVHCWFPASGTTWFGDLPTAKLGHGKLDRTGRNAKGAIHDAVQIMSHSGSRCARYRDGHVKCWSDGLTDGEGKTFRSLEAPAEPVTFMAGSFYQQCFVLRSGTVLCGSTDGVLRPRFAVHPRTVASTGGSICATGEDGSLSCIGYRWERTERPLVASLTEARVIDIGGRARSVVASTHQVCVLREDDAVLCASSETAPFERIALP